MKLVCVLMSLEKVINGAKKMKIFLYISLVLLIASLIYMPKGLMGQHIQSHEGPSCGACHCPTGFECIASLPDNCMCSAPAPGESD
jgi:hypothetical protein